MKQVPGINYLYRRGAKYVFYRRVPIDLVGKVDTTHPQKRKLGKFDKRSLRTADLDEAKRRVREEALAFDKRMDAVRKAHGLLPQDQLGESEIARISAAWRRKMIEDLIADPEFIRTPFGGDDGDGPEADDPIVETLTTADDLGPDNAWQAAAPEVQELLADEGMRLAYSDVSFRRLCRELLDIKAVALKVIRRLRAYERVVVSDFLPSPTSNGGGPLCSEAVKLWIAEKSKKRWVEKTRHEHEIWSQRFIEAQGDRPLASYTKADGRAFRALLQKLPPSWTMRPELKGLGVVAAAEKAQELGLPPMSDKNINKLIDYLGAFWRWAGRQYDECTNNPFSGLKLEVATLARDERHPFTLEELRTIFSAPRFTGCLGPQRLNESGDYVPRDKGVFWVPLIALFSGARLGEIVQLHVTDVIEKPEGWFFDIRGDEGDRRLKTVQSERAVPVHPELLALGFLAFVGAQREAKHVRLFPELKKGEDGYYSSPASKSFARWLKILGVKHAKNAFHSFRHCFEDARRAAGVSDEVGDALMGHIATGQKARYGLAFKTPAQLAPLTEAMSRIRYEGLSLDHLRVHDSVPSVSS